MTENNTVTEDKAIGTFVNTARVRGALGEALPYQMMPLIMMGIGLLSVYILIIRNKRHIRPIYEKDV